MKSNKLLFGILAIMLLSVLFCACNPQANTPESSPEKEYMEKRCAHIFSMYSDSCSSGADIDAIEDMLIGTGLDVMNTDGKYPAYLSGTDGFYGFWGSVCAGENAQQEIIRISESGDLMYTLFKSTDGTCFVHFMTYGFDDGDSPSVINYEKHTVQDMELTDRGNFYYRIYTAEDKHYADYTLIRLTPPDKGLYDLNLEYILPIGYQSTNIFVVDWNENHWGQLSFNDLFEYLYRKQNGAWFQPEAYVSGTDSFFDGVTVSFYEIPSALFESTLLPYFSISQTDFRQASFYQAEGDYYPWKPFLTNDVVWYPSIEPVVVDCVKNSDGTMTLYVDVLSTDLKTDRLFSHEVTVRCLENGAFQYVGNQITIQTEAGLPPNDHRLSYNKA